MSPTSPDHPFGDQDDDGDEGGSTALTTDVTTPARVPRAPRAPEHRHRRRKVAVAYRVLQGVAIALPPGIYLLFVERYAVNVLAWDDWAVEVPTVHFGLHGGRNFFWLLWLQYNEHRMVIPKLFFIVLGGMTSLNAKTVMLFSAGVFIATFVVLLSLVRRYAGRLPGPLGLVLLGAVWFSLADYESALLSTQLAWYLVLFFFMACLLALSHETMTWWVVAGAALLAVAASYSSLQGFAVWPVGLICLWRRLPDVPRPRPVFILWIGSAVASAGLYFWGYNFSSAQGPSSLSAVMRNPLGLLKFFFVDVGNVVPSFSHSSYGWHLVVGVLITAGAFGVLALSVREVGRDGHGALVPLPAALITFGLIFDVLASVGRAGSGESAALAPRYTMPNLVLLIGIAVYAYARMPARRSGPAWSWRPVLGAGLTVLLTMLMVTQVAVSTDFGLQGARVTRRSREIALTTLENLPHLPEATAERLVATYVYPSLPALEPLLELARQDHLGGLR